MVKLVNINRKKFIHKNLVKPCHAIVLFSNIRYRFIQIVFLMALMVMLITCLVLDKVSAITQFYFAIPSEIEDTTGTILSVDTDDEVFSWMDNGTDIIPANNNTPNTQADDTGMDLDANEYLLAIEDNLDIGTRVYMCTNLTSYSANLTYPICETDAIDKDRLARAALEFPSEFKVNK